MLKKKLYVAPVVVALLLTALAAAPAEADVVPITVHGHDLANAGLWGVQNRCSDVAAAATENPALSVVADAPTGFGATSAGWHYTQTGNEFAPLAYVPRPRDLSIFESHIKSPTGAAITGHAFGVFDPNPNNFAAGRFVGRSGEFTVSNTAWGGTWDGDVAMTWRWYANGAYVPGFDRFDTLKGIADFYATNGSGAYVGFALGCAGQQPFLMDGLQVGDASRSWRYNFEGKQPSDSHLEWCTAKCPSVRDGSFTIRVGQQAWALGHGHGHNGQERLYFTGPGTLYAKAHGRSSYRPVSTATFTNSRYAGFKIAPKRQTTYYFRTNGTSVMSPSVSETMTVKVRASVRSKVVKGRVTRGQRVAVEGRISPGNRGTKVSLQRKAGSRWRTVGKARTKARGRYVVSTKATKVGEWKVRVKVSKGGGNLGTTSRKMTVRVKKPAAPPPPAPPKDELKSAPAPTPTLYAQPKPDHHGHGPATRSSNDRPWTPSNQAPLLGSLATQTPPRTRLPRARG